VSRFAFYGRVSTEDAQDPVASRAWQLRRARECIQPTDGLIVAEYFDVGVSRALPWRRRLEAARLLEALRNSERGWNAVVIGEPQRAFAGAQYALTFPLLCHYGIELWVPEVGGRVDPDSEAHDLMMALFGGLSRAERTRTKTRVRAAMSALAAEGTRFLGGRPPYGYQLVDAGGHPNPAKAAAGQRLRRLEPDPVTAPIVRRIFEQAAAGHGLRAIAETLARDGIPSPAAHDRARNRHRDPRGWSHVAVKAILENPRYTGRAVWGRQRRHEELVDPDDVSAGNVSRLRWQPRQEWITGDPDAHPALVDDELFDAAALARQRRRPQVTRHRRSQRQYALRGLLVCGICERRMQATWRPSRGDGPGRVLYRCELRRQRALPPGVDHPPTVNLREAAILGPLHAWLAELAQPEWLASAQSPDPATTTDTLALREHLRQTERHLERYRAALEAGTDPATIAAWVAETTAKRADLQQRLARLARPTQALTADEIAALIDQLGGMIAILDSATPEERATIYRTLGLNLLYDPAKHRVRAQVEIACRSGSVGGGT
jgi:DNA invertase Pin-like site-specific DNA recombinase